MVDIFCTKVSEDDVILLLLDDIKNRIIRKKVKYHSLYKFE